jgi:hypothetical protein
MFQYENSELVSSVVFKIQKSIYNIAYKDKQ